MLSYPKDQKSILNISHSKLYNLARKLRLPPGSYEDIEVNQSDQEYIHIPKNTNDYVEKSYDVSNPITFEAQESQYIEPYNPQLEQVSSIIIQRHPFHQPLSTEQVTDPSTDDGDADDNVGYDPDFDRAAIEYAIDELRASNSDIESIDDVLNDVSDPIGEPSLESLAAEAMHDEMQEMPEMDQMQEQEEMDLEMIINGFFFPGG